jgi:hypothetical protein
MQAKIMAKLETIDTALRGDGRDEIGLVEHVRDLRAWRDEQEAKHEKRDSDARSIKTGLFVAVLLWVFTAIGGAVIAGAKAMGWGAIDHAGGK